MRIFIFVGFIKNESAKICGMNKIEYHQKTTFIEDSKQLSLTVKTGKTMYQIHLLRQSLEVENDFPFQFYVF